MVVATNWNEAAVGEGKTPSLITKVCVFKTSMQCLFIYKYILKTLPTNCNGRLVHFFAAILSVNKNLALVPVMANSNRKFH